VRVLLLHSDDDPNRGPWAQQPWERVIDLGIAGPTAYDGWSHLFHCPVDTLPKLELEDLKRVRHTLLSKSRRLLDAHGMDWWELISIHYHERLERIFALKKLADQIGSGDEVFVSRNGFDGRVMELLLGRPVRPLLPADSPFSRMRRKFRAAARLGITQIGQILGDKYDPDYRIRRWTSRNPQSCERPVVLLPTAYVNASRTALAYAAALPDRDFLLVATRQSGWVADPPRNVKTVRLASYAPEKRSQNEDEYQYLLGCWRKLHAEFRGCPELHVLNQLGALACVPAMLRDGLGVRDAWGQVFEREPVTAALCADDSNIYTRLTLLIARERGLPTIACHHGALDGRYFFKRSHADVILAKGWMEKDYLVNVCGVAEDEIEIGAPPREKFSASSRQKGLIVFFSEPYELAGGRCLEFYREVLPRLAEVAAACRRELVIKLHPQESLRERRGFLNAVLTPSQRQVVRIVQGKLSDELLRETWFAVTVVSTTALDCALRGIPMFLCTWLGYSNWRYAEQFARFGAGVALDSASEIATIPALLKDFVPGNTADLWQPILPERFDQLLSQPEAVKIAAVV
jgi:hypothetical protein